MYEPPVFVVQLPERQGDWNSLSNQEWDRTEEGEVRIRYDLLTGLHEEAVALDCYEEEQPHHEWNFHCCSSQRTLYHDNLGTIGA